MARWTRFLFIAAVLLGLLLAPNVSKMQAAVQSAPLDDLEDLHGGLPDFDARMAVVAPTAQQMNAASSLEASAVWNQFGTPLSLIKYGDFLATGLSGDAPSAARQWIRTNRALFRLSDATVTNLELVNDSQLPYSTAHVLLFRQRFGSLPAVQDGMISVALVDGKVGYVSSSAVGDAPAPGPATITPQQAWLVAAANVGRPSVLGSISSLQSEGGGTTFNVAGFDQPQQARLRALPIAAGQVRPVYEVNVVNSKGADVLAYTLYIDAQNQQVLFRQNRAYNLEARHPAQAPAVTPFNGAYTATACGPRHTFAVPAGTTKIAVAAAAVVPTNDIVLFLYNPDGTVAASADTATSPEAITYAPQGGIPAGSYGVQVCPFADPTVPATAPFTYAGSFSSDDTPVVNPLPYPPKWKFFKSNPPLDFSNSDSRVLGCWESTRNGQPPAPIAGCQLQLINTASRVPWDYSVKAGDAPTFTTHGNNALSGEAWLSPLTPAEQYRPLSAQREYIFPWSNQWKTSKCDPTVFASPTRNDIDAAVTNLFAEHNRMHDWSYQLGFTERNYNAQESNFGTQSGGTVPNGENDPEIGNSQAGAVDGGAPSYLGRDNANQIALQDGLPGISNMYLWQPIAAAFYAPCVDGDYDMSVIGHEYTHLISNRMVGGPDSNLTGHQAGSMGESWSDLDAIEYLQEHNFAPINSASGYVVGAYVTGNTTTGIRNYVNFTNTSNPLNYSDVGYDVGGPEVHSDAEIWDAVNHDIRRALMDKYDSAYKRTDAATQLKCAAGTLPPYLCPGNRRWIQLVYDAWLMMPPAVSMLGARDAMLAADQLRNAEVTDTCRRNPTSHDGHCWQLNQKELWHAFASRGMGVSASTQTNEDTDPAARFDTPAALEKNATITFKPVADSSSGAALTNAKIYAGHYEARATPIADTIAATSLGASAKFVPGTYSFVVQAPGYGLRRFSFTFSAGQSATLSMVMPSNWASQARGGVATGDGVNQNNLIDDTENTNWARLGAPVAGSQVTVQLGGGSHSIRRVQVSAMIHPADANDANDPNGQNRFSGLRQFKILACSANCASPANFRVIFTSPADAFPGTAPRPLAPQLIVREFTIPTTTATHVRLEVVTNQCTGNPAFQGEQDADPANDTDCRTSGEEQNVRAAELEVFSQ